MHVATHNIDAGELLLRSRSKVQSKVQEEINKEVEEMLEMGIIRPLRSPWESQLTLFPSQTELSGFALTIGNLKYQLALV